MRRSYLYIMTRKAILGVEDEEMLDVLCIGQYDKTGRFTTIQWKCFIEWCKGECNKLIIYTRLSYRAICSKIPLYCNISILEKPDKALDIYAYEINVENVLFWNYIANGDYSIDRADDISHMFFFYGEISIASLEIVDYENYVLIEGDAVQNDRLLANKAMVSENIQLCFKGKADIEGLSQQESWKPLGEVAKLNEEFKQLLLSEIKINHNSLLVLRECLLIFRSLGMDKDSMIRNLEELRNDSDTETEDILLELMDFVAGWCKPELSIFG